MRPAKIPKIPLSGLCNSEHVVSVFRNTKSEHFWNVIFCVLFHVKGHKVISTDNENVFVIQNRPKNELKLH